MKWLKRPNTEAEVGRVVPAVGDSGQEKERSCFMRCHHATGSSPFEYVCGVKGGGEQWETSGDNGNISPI